MSQATLSERPYVNSNLFSAHYLDERVQERDEWDCDQVARESMDELQSLYDLEGELVAGYNEDALIDNWIDEVLDELGFGTQVEVTLPDGGGFVDELLFENPTARRDAAKLYLDTEETTDLFERGVGIVEAKQWDADFTVQFSEQRPYRNSSHQTKHYLEKTPSNIQWGILTNGRKWRLYGTNDYETQTYYEVDLPELLQQGDLEAFKYFYVFFRPAAFHESSGTTFLDEVWSESETALQELGENLQDNVFTALRVLGRGFVETNDDLDIDPDDDEALDELKEQSLVFLYRLMFVLYAEARGLIHPEGQSAQDEYDQNFSLDELRLDIHDTIGEVDEGFEDEFTDHSTTMWRRLEDLFRLIDQGEEDLGIPPYNGGLFDHEEHDFLTDHGVSNQYLAEVIYRLSTTQNDEGRYVLADYADLDTRHLGSVYEGLLEHQFRIAPEQYAAVAEDGSQVWKPATEVSVAGAVETVPEGGLYVVNDEGERKATGAYYTPDYVVTYIVEETVSPLVEKIREDLIGQGFDPGTQEYIGPFLRRITDLRLLDPAMGSGHFLTKATGYLSEQVMSEVRDVEAEMGVAFDEQHVRREIANECIYGVDLNGMAVELAKLSMWLETLAADRPLAFLDHHLKTGNSLVGSDIDDIEELESDSNGDDEQSSLAEFGATREGTIERLMEIYRELLAIENETINDVRAMKRKYAEIEQDELRRRLVAMANVHTAERFDLDIPGGAYERMARALEDDEKWANVEETEWFRSAQTIAGEQNFFHWELEFPEVFFSDDGERREDAGFDSVIGNPPYVRIQELNQSSDELIPYLRNTYNVVEGKFDLYLPFISQGANIIGNRGISTMIVPNKFMKSSYGDKLRQELASEKRLRFVLDFGDFQVFDNLSTYTCILSIDSEATETAVFATADSQRLDNTKKNEVEHEDLEDSTWSGLVGAEGKLLKSLLSDHNSLGDISEEIYQGVITGGDDHFILEKVREGEETITVQRRDNGREHRLEKETVRPFSKGADVRRYQFQNNEKVLLYPYYSDRADSPLIPESVLEDKFPYMYSYISEYRSSLESRGSDSMEYPSWYSLWNPRSGWKFENEKLVTPVIAKSGRFAYDDSGMYFNGSGGGGGGAYGIILDETDYMERAIAAILNSSVCDFIIRSTSSQFQGGYYAYNRQYIENLPIPNHEKSLSHTTKEKVKSELAERTDSPAEILCGLVKKSENIRERRSTINIELLDYLGAYDDGERLPDVGFYQPAAASDSILHEASEDNDDHLRIRIGDVRAIRDDTNSIRIEATARYRPDEGEDFVQTEYQPAFQLTDLSEMEADLVEAFVPIAADKANGFAGFRKKATKTNSLIDRLESITLPRVDDIADELKRYNQAKKRALELYEDIQRIDDLINQIVYDLYGLTDEEIEIVEEAVVDD